MRGAPVLASLVMGALLAAPVVRPCAARAATADHASKAAGSKEAPASVVHAAAQTPGEPAVVSFEAADGVQVSADLYANPAAARAPIVLLFHQAASNAGEYSEIAPRLVELGWNALAVDSRSGGRMWGRTNRTVMRLGRSTDFLTAYADLEAAVAWAKSRGYAPPLAVWGSSYTSALVFRLAAEHPEIGAVLSFSPGEYLGPDEPVRAWAAKVKVPVFVTTATGHEVAVAKRILDASPAALRVQHEPDVGVHGSSTLREDRNPGGTEGNWSAVIAFLKQVRGK
jgi:dienelactone hydrolase